MATVACASNSGYQTYTNLPVRQLNLPEGGYVSASWLTNSSLVVQYEPYVEKREFTNNLWLVDIDSLNMQVIDLEYLRTSSCVSTKFNSPILSQNGQIVFESYCYKLGLSASEVYLMLLDSLDASATKLFSYPLPFGNARFSFAPDLRRGILSSSTGIDDHLYWIDANSAISVTITMARANMPAWSPSDTFVAFWGNRNLAGASGPQWATQPYDLWLMTPDCDSGISRCDDKLTRILSGVEGPSTLEWSPDSRWLAFDGSYKGSGNGIWLLNLRAKSVHLVLEGDYRAPKWSPDGKQIMILGPLIKSTFDGPTYRSRLLLVDVTSVLETDQ